MKAEDVVELYTLLLDHGVQIWIDGGWGIDALLGQQTRSHKDLDAFVVFDDLPTLTALLSQRGFVLKEIWSENQWRRHGGHVRLIGTGEPTGEVATAFVVKDALGREIDIHVMDSDEHGSPTDAVSRTRGAPCPALEPGTAHIRLANPFSAVPTSFEVTARGQTYWANCAWDAFGIPAALHADGDIQTSYAIAGTPLHIRVRCARFFGDGGLVHFPLPCRWYDDLVFT